MGNPKLQAGSPHTWGQDEKSAAKLQPPRAPAPSRPRSSSGVSQRVERSRGVFFPSCSLFLLLLPSSSSSSSALLTGLCNAYLPALHTRQ